MRCLLIVLALAPGCVVAAGGKLLATPGITQFEGSGGGGIVPWATLAGYATRDQVAVSTFVTRVQADDFALNAYGVAVNIHDRIELSVARHSLDVAPLSQTIDQGILGAKLRLYGDIVYSDWPQVSIGLQHKQVKDSAIPFAVGATDDESTDFYIAATKLHLGAALGYNVLWGATARATRANQVGLLGFGGDENDGFSLQLEGSIAVLMSRNFAIGAEYRSKPDNLSAAPEDDWYDIFIAAFPNKHVNMTFAYADLGNIAGVANQRGVYFSITGYIK